MKTTDSVNRPQPKIEAPKVDRPAAPSAETPATPAARPNVVRDAVDTRRPAAAPMALPTSATTTSGDEALLKTSAGGPNLFTQQLADLKAARGVLAPAAAVPTAAGGGGTTPPSYQDLSPADQASAQEAIAYAHDSRDATKVAEWLQAHPDPKQQQAFMDMMFQYGPVAGEVLNNSQFLSEDQKDTVANALERSFESGAVSKEEFQNSIERYGYGAGPVETHEGLGDIVGRTHDEGLINAYVEKELDVMKNGDENADAFRSFGIANALGGLSGPALQRYMEAHPEEMKTVMEGLGRDGGYGYTQSSTGLGALLEGAANIQPPTKEALALFDQAIPLIGDNVSSREGAAAFMSRNMDEVLASYQDDSGSLTLDGQRKLSEVFARTMFTEPPFEGQDQFKNALLSKMAELSRSMETQANQNPPSLASQRDARLLGSLIGVVEGGFQKAVDELDARNEAVDGMVDLLFKATSFIPDLPFPGGGLIKDKGIDAIKDWVKNSLHEQAEDPEDAIPFHEAFAQGIDNPNLRSQYDSARADAFINVARGLTD